MSLPINSRIADAEDVAPTLQAAKSKARGGTDGPLVFVSEASSPGSAGSITGSQPPDTGTCSSASPTRTGGTCSPPAGPECPSTRTFVRSTRPHGPVESELNDERWEETDVHPTLTPDATTQNVLIEATTYALSPEAERSGEALTPSPDAEGRIRLRPPSFGLYREESPTLQSGRPPSICSVAASLARTSPSPDAAPGSAANGPASSSSSPGSLRLFDPDGYSSRTFPVSSLARAVGTSEQSLERWPTSGTAWPGGFSTAATSTCRSDEGGCSSSEPSLTEILEPPQNVPGRYSLSARAANGILRRAERRGRTLPQHLQRALWLVAQTRKAWAPVTPGWLRYLALERAARTTTTGREAS